MRNSALPYLRVRQLAAIALLFAATSLATGRGWQSSGASLGPVVVTAPGRNVDSPAIWLAPDRADSLILLTEKATGRVMVFAANEQGKLLRRTTRMRRPNGIAIVYDFPLAGKPADIAFITDRDANRIDAYTLPDFRHVGRFGQELRQPMGIAAHRDSAGAAFLYVVPKLGYDKWGAVRFRVTENRGRIQAIRDMGFASELTKDQETIWVDSERERVLIADEAAQLFRVYSLDGRFLQDVGKGQFQAQVEGIVTVLCGARGYVIAVDQLPVSEFEIFDRDSFVHLGRVITAAKVTDGIAATTEALPGFPGGLLVAQSDPDDSGGLHAEFYDLNRFLQAGGLPACR